MPEIQCPILGCEYVTADVDAAVAASLLLIHNNVHLTGSGCSQKQKPPKIDRPKVCKGISEEAWNIFIFKWEMFKEGTSLTVKETMHQLFQCCDEDLSEDILRWHKETTNGTEGDLISAIKSIAVTPVAITVRRSELLSMKQSDKESVRSFFARINGKASTCAYTIACSSSSCAQVVDFTSEITKDILVTGIADEEIRKDVLGWSDLDKKSTQETVAFIEAKEMARDAMLKQATNAALESKRGNGKSGKKVEKIQCKECSTDIEKFIWNRRQGKTIERDMCFKCWKKSNPPKGKGSQDKKNPPHDETSALQNNATDLMIGTIDHLKKDTKQRNCCSMESSALQDKRFVLDHHIFDSQKGWTRAESMEHPTLRLRLSVDEEDYKHTGLSCPNVQPSKVTVVSDTGAMSCLWSRKDFLRCGFQLSDLAPIKRTMVAANREEIAIDGALFIRLSGLDVMGNTHTAPVMVYVSPSTERFYLSRQALVQLKVISKDFPRIGATLENGALKVKAKTCSCKPRTLPPPLPKELPFECIPENNDKMKEWLINRFSSSTFNTCPHQPLVGMTGPDIELHVDPSAKPIACRTPAMVPLH